MHVTADAVPFADVIYTAQPCSGPTCTWEMADWGSWVYSPDVLPTGDELFETGAADNVGSWSDPLNDTLIVATVDSSSKPALVRWQDYVAHEAPVIWEPSSVDSLTEISKKLSGVTPQNPLLAITPEEWRFTSSS